MGTFDELDAKFKHWLDLSEDPGLVRLLFGAVCANFYEGNPVWVMFIGPAGVGKTELLMSITGSKKVTLVTSISSKSLLSGYDSKEENSLLPSMNGKIMVISDMSALTETEAGERGAVYSILRTAYDGYASRHVGGAKRKVEFKGKLGILGAATPAIESSRKLESLLGERFIFIRPRMNSEGILDNPKIMRNVTAKAQLRGELMSEASSFVDNWSPPAGGKMLPRSIIELAKKLAKVLCKLRSVVVRDNYNKEISFPVDTNEMPVRLYDQLVLLLSAMRYLGAEKTELKKAVCRVVTDSIPSPRFKVLNCIVDGVSSVSAISEKIGLSRSYTDRTIEDLTRLGVIFKEKTGDRNINVIDNALIEALKEARDVKALVDAEPDVEVPLSGGEPLPVEAGGVGAQARRSEPPVAPRQEVDLHERGDDERVGDAIAAELRAAERRLYADDEPVVFESRSYATVEGPSEPFVDGKTRAAGGD